MADFIFNQGNVNTVMLTVLGLSGTLLNFPTDYTTPQLRISHINGGNEVEDLSYTNMVQVPSSNRWYYKYSISDTASFTRYLVTFRSVMEGIITYTVEEFRVVPATGAASGAGEFEVDVEVVNSETAIPIAGAIVLVRDYNNPVPVLASGFTNAAGIAKFFLNSGTYAVEFKKTGDVTEVHKLIVNVDGTYSFEGD